LGHEGMTGKTKKKKKAEVAVDQVEQGDNLSACRLTEKGTF